MKEWHKLFDDKTIEKVIKNLKKNGIEEYIVKDKLEAKKKVSPG